MRLILLVFFFFLILLTFLPTNLDSGNSAVVHWYMFFLTLIFSIVCHCRFLLPFPMKFFLLLPMRKIWWTCSWPLFNKLGSCWKYIFRMENSTSSKISKIRIWTWYHKSISNILSFHIYILYCTMHLRYIFCQSNINEHVRKAEPNRINQFLVWFGSVCRIGNSL